MLFLVAGDIRALREKPRSKEKSSIFVSSVKQQRFIMTIKTAARKTQGEILGGIL